MGGRHKDHLAAQLVSAIREGDVGRLAEILAGRPELIHTKRDGRTLLHHATDWPGTWPRVGETIALLARSGADVNARFPHPGNPDVVAETPLHWAASCGNGVAVDALLDAGADIDPLGGIFDGCTPFEEAIIFEHYGAAERLLARGAASYLPGAAALGQMERVRDYFTESGILRLDVGMLPQWKGTPSAQVLLDRAFQFACRAGHLEIAKLLKERGADVDSRTPARTSALDEAQKNGHAEVVAWLSATGAE